MGIQKAVASSVRTPGVWILINLLAGTQSLGAGGLRCLVIAQKSADGDLTEDTEVRSDIAGPDDAATGFGTGMTGHLAVKRLFEEYPTASVDIAAPIAASGVAAHGLMVFGGGNPTVDKTYTGQVCGREITFTWLAGTTPTTAGDQYVAEIGKLADDLPVTATNTAGSVRVDARGKGTWGNDIVIAGKLSSTVGNGSVTVTAFANGTTEFNVTNVLAATSREYDFVLLCTSNADAQTASASSNLGRLKTWVAAQLLRARFPQVICACTGAVTATNAAMDVHDYAWFEVTHDENGRSLPCEFAGAEVGARMREETLDTSRNVNRCKQEYKAQLYQSASPATDTLTATEVEAALQAGTSPTGTSEQGTPFIWRPITTYHEDSSGNPDDRIIDVAIPSVSAAIGKDLRSYVPGQFLAQGTQPGVKIVSDAAIAAVDDVPPGVVAISSVRAAVSSRMRAWAGTGAIDGAKLAEAIADGSLVVEIDGTDPHQTNMFLPYSVIPIAAKFSIVLAHKG